ncbi:hypothetical protein Trydic_g10209 [Trypoxylus dichotomus]
MAEEISVVLNRNESSGFGFSLLGKPGLPPIIYNILEDSPAAESGEEDCDLSSKQLDDDASKILNKAIARAPMLDRILVVEMLAGKMQPREAAVEYRWEVRTGIEKAKPINDGNSLNNNYSY